VLARDDVAYRAASRELAQAGPRGSTHALAQLRTVETGCNSRKHRLRGFAGFDVLRLQFVCHDSLSSPGDRGNELFQNGRHIFVGDLRELAIVRADGVQHRGCFETHHFVRFRAYEE